MSSDTLTTLNGLTKEKYGDSVINVVPSFAKILKMTKFSQRDKIGAHYNQPVILSNQQGITFGNSSSTLPLSLNASIAMTMANAQISSTFFALRGQIGVDAIVRSASQDQAVEDALELFISEVNDRALEKMEMTGVLEGAHHASMKEVAKENVLLAIRRVLAGQVYLSEEMQEKMFRSSGKRSVTVIASPLERLSDRELEVFRLHGQGVGTRQVAKQLNLSLSTVYSHRARIRVKLGAYSGTELLQQAVKWVETEGLG